MVFFEKLKAFSSDSKAEPIQLKPDQEQTKLCNAEGDSDAPTRIWRVGCPSSKFGRRFH